MLVCPFFYDGFVVVPGPCYYRPCTGPLVAPFKFKNHAHWVSLSARCLWEERRLSFQCARKSETSLVGLHFSSDGSGRAVQARRANFALAVDVNASSKEQQAQDQTRENEHNN